MIRTTLLVILVSCVLGAALGFGAAFAFLSINGWQFESESKSYETLAQSAKEQVTNPDAKAFIGETVYNFGVKDVKATGTHDYYIKNVGSSDLTLKLDGTTCSCTGIDIKPTRVAPGKTAVCHLKYNAERAMTGKFSQGGTIVTNDPENQEIQLIIEGVFTAPVVAQPSPVNMQKVAAGTTRTAVIRFYGFEDTPLEFSAPSWTDRDHFDFEWKTAELNDADKNEFLLPLAKHVIEGTITAKPGLAVGSFQEHFEIKTNYPNHPVVEFVVNGQVAGGSVSVSGAGYNKNTGIAVLGNTVAGKKIVREILIQFSGLSAQSATLQVKSVEPAWLKAELLPPKDAGSLRVFSLMIEVPANAPIGNYILRSDGQIAQIMLATNDESMPTLKIPVQFAVSR
jgi:hypothetical protein